jgi:Na+/melibiose symporter-like transporter
VAHSDHSRRADLRTRPRRHHSTYLPVLAEDFSDSSTVVGLLIGGEGLMALWLPLVVGSWSDRLRTPIGGRLPFIIAATPPLVVSLALLGFVHSVATAAVVVAVFFAGYIVAYEPYRALYPDLVDNEIAGRAQSSQAIFRGLGTFLALLGGGLLISISDPLPFLAAAAIAAACMAAFAATGVRHRRRERASGEADIVAVAFRIRPAALRGRPAGVPRRQRALGARAGRAEDLRRPVRHAHARVLARRVVGRDRGGRAHRARGRSRQRPAR